MSRPGGLWRGENGDELSLTTTNKGEVIGIYRACSGDEVREYSLSGCLVGDRVAFSVPLVDRGAVSSWTGRLALDKQGPRLDAQWRVFGEEGSDFISHHLSPKTSGASCFRPVTAGSGVLLKGDIVCTAACEDLRRN